MLRWVNPPFTAFTLRENWKEIGAERYNLRKYWVRDGDIPKNIKWAVVASEDQRFWEHNGLDVRAIEKAIEENEKGERVRGASTITQQVAKNLFLWSGKSYFRKGLEAGFALTIDVMWPKERILEMYLNIGEFGPGVFGIGKAAEHFFHKKASELTADESARMAAVLPNPKRMRIEPASPYVNKRKLWILRNMEQLSGIGYLPRPKPDTSRSIDNFDSDSMKTQNIHFEPIAPLSILPFHQDSSFSVDREGN